jgi:hypothetical protein
MELFASRSAVLRRIFSRPAYTALTLGVALVFYLLNAFILQWKNLHLVTASNAFSFFTAGVYYLTTRISFYTFLLVSILTGILVSLLVFRARASLLSQRLQNQQSHNTSVVSSLGVAAGVLLPGCASCGIGLAAVLGLGSSFAALPLQGLEISLIAIVLLCISISMVAKSMTIHAACALPRKRR